ncbi:hypothetical protein [Lysobacter sp. A03]|uniref:hypothetical protein n=1 Tax=Lysobacter sp. A03 TaxID=1199154 RepID=UPI0005B6D160|nr:hypothetical protein [Lysobacter sp. A03]KIQ97330.1 hypothetical protein TI01_1122 [Lysobacter sp. A03]
MQSRTLTIVLAVGLSVAVGNGWPLPAQAAQDNLSKVTGSINVEAGAHVGSINTVNGSVDIGANSEVGNVATVNGSIKLANGVRAGQLSTVNGSIRGGRETHAGSASTVNGQIFIDRGSDVSGNISTVNGAIGLVGTRVEGGIEMVNGDLTVGANSNVMGGIHYDKPGFQWFSLGNKAPRVVVGPAAQVEGAMVFERDVELYVHESARIGKVTGATAKAWSGSEPPPKD